MYIVYASQEVFGYEEDFSSIEIETKQEKQKLELDAPRIGAEEDRKCLERERFNYLKLIL